MPKLTNDPAPELDGISSILKPTNSAQKENAQPNEVVTKPTVTIFAEEYARLLKQEIQLIKYKESCQTKSAEVKRLQDQLAYYRKQVLLLRRGNEDEPENKKPFDFANVMSFS